MNIKVALGCISVSAALAFWACADGEVITADASEEVALQQVLHNRVTVEEAIASCNGNEACVAEMTDAPAADAPDSPKDEGAPDNAESSASADNGSSLPGTNPGADNDPVITPSSPSVTPDVPVTPVTPTTSSASVTPVSSASQGGGQSSASTPTTSSASTPKSSASGGGSGGKECPTTGTAVVLEYNGDMTELSAGTYKLTSNNQWSGKLRCKADENVTVQVDCADATVTTSLSTIGDAAPTGQNSVILVVPTGKKISCHTNW